MDTRHILCTLREVKSFFGVFPSDIINSDPQPEKGSHWLAVHFLPKSTSAYFFDSYGILPLVPDIAGFIKRICTVWYCKRKQLQGLTFNVCGKYCCLFAVYTDSGFTPKQFVGLFDGASANRLIDWAFASEFGSPCGSVGQCSSSLLCKVGN